jgi:hypothetical protein
MHYPNGYQYSIITTNFRGYANLNNVTNGYQKSTYSFSGGVSPEPSSSAGLMSCGQPQNFLMLTLHGKTETTSASAQANIKGPVVGDYEVTTYLDVQSQIYSSCGTDIALNINNEVSLTGSGEGEITEDTVDQKITFVAGVQWQKCSS